MLSNHTSSAVRSAIAALQRCKGLNALTSDCFETALQVEQQQQQASEKKSKRRDFQETSTYASPLR